MLPQQWLVLAFSSVALAATTTRSCLPLQTSGLSRPWPSKDYQPLCLRADARAEAPVNLKSTYPDGAKVVYAFQNFTTDEILDAATDDIILDEYDHLQVAGVWFEYGKSNFDKKAERVTEFGLDFLADMNGTTEGASNGGCDGVLGQECADGIKAAMQAGLLESTNPHGRRPTIRVGFFEAYDRINWTALSCPEAVSNAGFPQTDRIGFETEAAPEGSILNPDENVKESYIYPSGNASWAYLTYAHTNTYEVERTRTAFGILVQYPYVEELDGFDEVPESKWFTKDDFNVNLICIKHDKTKRNEDGSEGSGSTGSDSSGSNDSGGEDDEGSAMRSARVGVLSLTVGVATAVAVYMI